MIAITGATGQLGRLVIAALLKKVPANQIIAAVRNPEKAKALCDLGIDVRKADYSQPATLESAFKGVEKLLLISSSEVGQREAQHQAVIDAAKRAGVKLVAYTSLLHADKKLLGLSADHLATEAALRASGLPVVVLRNGWYHENYTGSIAPALAHGGYIGAMDEGRVSSAARKDYAEAAAAVLVLENQAGKVYELAGDKSYTLTEFAAEISRQSGTTVNYINQTQAQYASTLTGVGLDQWLADMLADSAAGAAKGGLFDDSHTLSKLIGRNTTPYQEAITAALKAL